MSNFPFCQDLLVLMCLKQRFLSYVHGLSYTFKSNESWSAVGGLADLSLRKATNVIAVEVM